MKLGDTALSLQTRGTAVNQIPFVAAVLLLTLNISPAPSQSLVVSIGVFMCV
jgi:hypothetical protein